MTFATAACAFAASARDFYVDGFGFSAHIQADPRGFGEPALWTERQGDARAIRAFGLFIVVERNAN